MKLIILVAVLAAASAQAQGTFTLGSTAPTGTACPTSYVCTQFTVSAPNIPDRKGVFAHKRGATGRSGLVQFYSGSEGSAWWATTTASLAMLNNLIAADYDVVQVRWINGWIGTPLNVNAGQRLLAQRPSTAMRAITERYLRGGRSVVVGSSNGSTQVSYSLAFYGVSVWFDVAVIVSGPPYMELCRGCLQESGYAYPSNAANWVDESYGYKPYTGPCYQHLSSWCPWEEQNSVNAGGVYNYPTRMAILLGSLDSAFILNRGLDYYNLLISNGQNAASIQHIGNTGHSFQGSTNGLAAIYNQIIN